jgi:tetratricopeptide (TPR) repeat protein
VILREKLMRRFVEQADRGQWTLYLRKDEYDLAIRAFDEAIRLKPDYGEAFANRATAYLKKKTYDHAARDFDERSE